MNLGFQYDFANTQYLLAGYQNPFYQDNAWENMLQSVFNGFCLWDMPKNKVQKSTGAKSGRSIDSYDFSQNIARLYNILSKHQCLSEWIIRPYKKSRASNSKRVSKRRSKYIGVTRNSRNYQALIVINGKKTYIGSYESELEAAKVFDWYSILLHAKKATTNFSYSGDDIVNLIQAYQQKSI